MKPDRTPTHKTITFLIAFGVLSISAEAVVLTFGSNLDLIAPTPVYTEQGFVITASNTIAGLLPPQGSFSSIYYGYQTSPGANLTIQSSNLGSFDLKSMDIGLVGFSAQLSTDITIVGDLAAGGTISANFNGVSTVQNVILNWSGLTKVTFTGTNDPGFDNIDVTAVPESSSTALLGLSVISVVFRRLRKK